MTTTLADINSQIQQHDQQIAQLRKQAEELRNQERASVIDEVRKKIADYGLTAADLKLTAGGRGGKRNMSAAAKPAPVVKYRNQAGETWSGGRGRKPRWIAEALAAGQSLAAFEVK